MIGGASDIFEIWDKLSDSYRCKASDCKIIFRNFKKNCSAAPHTFGILCLETQSVVSGLFRIDCKKKNRKSIGNFKIRASNNLAHIRTRTRTVRVGRTYPGNYVANIFFQKAFPREFTTFIMKLDQASAPCWFRVYYKRKNWRIKAVFEQTSLMKQP